MKISFLLRLCLISFAINYSDLAFALNQPLANINVDLLEVYHQALLSDPVLKSAAAAHGASLETLPQNRASLLPRLTLTANSNANRLNTSPEGTAPSTVNNYNSKGYTLEFSQPIINIANWLKLKQATFTIQQADATYQAACAELILRVTKAYLAVLLAQDKLNFTQAEEDANAQQLAQIGARYQVGLETITSLDEARAAYDTIVAQRITAQNNLTNAYEQLSNLTGLRYTQLAHNKQAFPLITPEPNQVETWVVQAIHANPQLTAASYAAQAAKENVQINRAAYYPTINAVGSYQNANNPNNSQMNNNLQTTSIGLQLNIPLYQGGATHSALRQAEYLATESDADLQNLSRQTITNTRSAFNNILAGITKVKADKQALLSSQSALVSTQTALKVGTRTILDVLNAQQDYFSAQANYATDQYQYIIDTLTLKELAGILTEQDLILVNTWLNTDLKKIKS